MAEPRRQFEIVQDESEIAATQPSRAENAAMGILAFSLKALSQRALVAIADLFTLTTVFSAFYLWWSIPDPNQQQIVSLTIYAAFVLAANWLVRRK